MKSFLRISAFALLMVWSPAAAQWQQTNPAGGTNSSFFEHNGKLYIASLDYGVCVSTNGGLGWKSSNTGMRSGVAWSLAEKGKDLYVGTDAGVYHSSDDGATWYADGLQARNVFSLKTFGKFLFAATDSGLYRSTEGSTWTISSTDIQYESVRCMSPFGPMLFAGTLAHGIFRSLDTGATWQPMSEGLSDTTMLYIGSHDNLVYAGSYSGGIFRSADSGKHWSVIDTGLTSHSVISLYFLGETILAATYGGGVFRSTDRGDTWTSSNTGLTSRQVGEMIMAKDILLAATWNGRGIYRSSDSGRTWSLSTAGVPALNGDVTALRVIDTTLFAGSFNYYSNQNQFDISTSTDGGFTWSDGDKGLSGAYWYIEDFAALDENGVRSILVGTNNNGVFRSADNGLSWQPASEGLSSLWVNTMLSDRGVVLAGTYKGVMRSTDGGSTWNRSSTGIDDSVILALSLDTLGETRTIYSAAYSMDGYRGTIYYSQNGGESWVKTGTVNGIPHKHIVPFDKGIFAMSDSGLFYSTDRGETWTRHDNGAGNAHFFTVVPIGSILLAGTDSGVYLSLDHANSWTPINEGLSKGNDVISFGVPEVAVLNNYVFAGTYPYGIWRRPLAEILPSSVASALPKTDFKLRSSANPFRESTTITFTIPTVDRVRLDIVDAEGRELINLMNRTTQAGEHSLVFERNKLPAGVYFCRMTGDAGVQVLPLIIE